jgi:hypothetical protein
LLISQVPTNEFVPSASSLSSLLSSHENAISNENNTIIFFIMNSFGLKLSWEATQNHPTMWASLL